MKLLRYIHAIIVSNLSSIVTLDRDWVRGWLVLILKDSLCSLMLVERVFLGGCSQFVELDACFLKRLCKGVLLFAVSIDANYEIYPLVVCTVENENKESWVCFIERLYEQIGYNDRSDLYFMSDRQKGILNALEKVFLQALKRYCCRHIYGNF